MLNLILNLTFLSSAAALTLIVWFNIAAWMSVSPRAWQYDLWSIAVLLLWSQPWRSRDRFRTDRLPIRYATYFLVTMAALAFFFIFDRLVTLIIVFEAIILYLIESRGQRSARES